MPPLPTDPTLGDLVRAGALGRALRRLAQGWRDDAILMNLEAAYPGAQPYQYTEILRLAHSAAAAAGLQQRLAAGERVDIRQIPLIPPG